MRNMFTRDHIIWNLMFVSAILLAAATQTSLIADPVRVQQAKDIALLLALAGKLANSPLPGDTTKEK